MIYDTMKESTHGFLSGCLGKEVYHGSIGMYCR